MSKINDLIKEMCPNGVRFDYLGNICSSLKKGTLKTTELIDEGYPVINSGRKLYGYYSKYNNEGNAFSIAARGEYAGFVNYFDDKFWAGGLCYPYHSVNENNVKTKFVYFYLKKIEKKIRSEIVADGSIPALNKSDLEKIKIPIPPIEVQEEIVRILDKFSKLEVELEAELEKRKDQYEFWSEKIFKNNISGKTKHITDIALVKARVGWQRLTTSEYLDSGDYYLITGTDFIGNGRIDFNRCIYVTKERYDMDVNIQVHKNDILITKDGTLGKVAFLDTEPDKLTTLNSGVFRIKIVDENVLPRYIYHYFNSKVFKDFIESVKTGSTIPHLTQEKLVSLNIPIPDIKTQEKIINILDRFDGLTKNMSEGLPAEIELRKQQYEYYRNKLLSFEEL